MIKRDLLRFDGILLYMVLLVLSGCSKLPDSGKPNFVWIISEDNSVHYMELFDPNGIATPNLERMASNGLLFTRAFSNAPVCSVARSTLISSCYAPRTGSQFHRRSEPVPLPEGLEMFPAYLREAGYYTTNNSKEDYNFIRGEGVWDESSANAQWTNRAPGQAFFHVESHPVSHESSLHFGSRLSDTYSPHTDPDSVVLFPNHPDTELFRFTAAYYRDRILAVDTIVGGVLERLEKEGLLESTFVFYFGDHGGVLPGSKGYTYETGLHIPLVVRIPDKYRHLVRMKKGSSVDGFVSFVDFGPTLLELAGIEVPEEADGRAFFGRDISPEVLDERQLSYGYADRFDEKYDMVRTVRKGDLKYMRSYQPFNPDGLQNNYRYLSLAYQQWREMYHAGELNAIQSKFFETREPEALYDLASDPFETHNLAANPDYGTQLKEMRGLLSRWVKGMPDLSFYPENRLRREAFSNPVEFGRTHREAIAELVDIADLALLPFNEAHAGIESALDSDDPLKHYWGLIVCSCFGNKAAVFSGRAIELCASNDLLVQTRAAEFLGLTGLGDPVPVLRKALYKSEDGVEALLVLNSLVLLMDGPDGYRFDLDMRMLSPEIIQDAEVQRRLGYISSRMDADFAEQ